MLLTAQIGLHGAGAGATRLADRVLPAQVALQDTSVAQSGGEAAFVLTAEATDPATRAAQVTAMERYGVDEEVSWRAYLGHALDGPRERLQRAYEAASNHEDLLVATVISSSPRGAPSAGVVATDRHLDDLQLADLASIDSAVYDPVATQAVAQASSGIQGARDDVLICFGVLGAFFALVGLVLMRGARRDQRLMTREAALLRAAGEQADFERSFQRGLEMAPTEEAAYEIVGQALSMIAPDIPAELLIADSSRAHLRQVLGSHPGSGTACRVGTPADCPAAASGQTHVSEDSTRLDTCRFLRGQEGPVWAVCAPVHAAGRATGVVHAQGRLGVEPAPLAVALDLVARRAGDRIGALRVLGRAERQAHVDPVTGLPNRRALESQVHELVTHETPYVVAFADLDHFKAINDAHGHDTGDRALRLFARVLRDSIRPNDLVARYGGEEFVAVLPDCTKADARAVAERVRSELAAALGHATVPDFTVTIGLADGNPGDTLADVVAAADAIMLSAKSLGRDRVLATGDLDEGPATEGLTTPVP